MRKISKKKVAFAAIVILVLIVYAFAPKPIHIEFAKPMESKDLDEMFRKISIENFDFMATGAVNSGGSYAENIERMYLMEHEWEKEYGEEFGIKTIDGTVSAGDYFHLITHKKQYGISQLRSFQVLLGMIEDGIEHTLLWR